MTDFIALYKLLLGKQSDVKYKTCDLIFDNGIYKKKGLAKRNPIEFSPLRMNRL